MSDLSKLLIVTDEEKLAMLKHHDTSEAEFDESVEYLREWVKKSEHLPNNLISDTNRFRVLLLNSKMSLEIAKQCTEGYYKVRTMYSDIFDIMVPNTEEFDIAKRVVRTAVMPKLSPSLCRITVFSYTDHEGEAPDAIYYHMLPFMTAEMRITHDYFLSNIIVVDFKNFYLKNIMKYTPSINQKLANVLIILKLRIEEIHFLNSPPFMDYLMTLVRNFIPSKLVERIHIHKDNESLRKFLPSEYLPSEYGGTQGPLEDLHNAWCKVLSENEEFLRELTRGKCTAKFETDAEDRDLLGLGAEGSFKKLAID